MLHAVAWYKISYSKYSSLKEKRKVYLQSCKRFGFIAWICGMENISQLLTTENVPKKKWQCTIFSPFEEKDLFVRNFHLFVCLETR